MTPKHFIKKIIFAIACTILGIVPMGTRADAPVAGGAEKSADTPSVDGNKEIISFSWRPKNGPVAAYKMDDPADQHKIIIFSGAEKSSSPTVLVGFHGQPARGKNPREYAFGGTVEKVVRAAIEDRTIPPVILVLPVFRFLGQNWPDFNLVEFKQKIVQILATKHIVPKKWYLFGHSGAAGCGGDGLNQAARIAPDAVGFFDTCLGTGWQDAVKALKSAHIQTLHLHSVETAGFRPKQRPEYQARFDFGRAYGPLGLNPVDCPDSLPAAPLRNQPYRCAAVAGGKVEAFVVDTGEGEEAHKKLLPIALTYFLRRFIGR